MAEIYKACPFCGCVDGLSVFWVDEDGCTTTLEDEKENYGEYGFGEELIDSASDEDVLPHLPIIGISCTCGGSYMMEWAHLFPSIAEKGEYPPVKDVEDRLIRIWSIRH